MAIQTENLTILFVDIAGFTATTNRQSRAQNAALLHTFDSTLMPHIKRYKGRVVKSIGDALLLTFRSPTDAMLCAMAMQDAMHAANLRLPDEEKIHIRVAANLGEVRVTPKDIFGEPVNVASRIEGIAPADEIYLSEAVFMAMNKAEVPAQEVGFKELAGIPQAIRIYSIPRFATHRLVPQNAVPEQGGELLYPYGGMHQHAPHGGHVPGKFALPLRGLNGKVAAGVAAVAATAIAAAAWMLQGPHATPPPAPAVARAPDAGTQAPQPVAKPEPVQAAGNAPAKTTSTSRAAHERVKPAPVEVASVKSAVSKKAQTKAPEQWTVSEAKQAARAGRISKAEYKTIARQRESDYKHKVSELKSQYKGRRISKAEYEHQVRMAKQEYLGN